MRLNLSLGMDLRTGLTPDQASFIRPSALRMSFDLHAANLNAGLAVGFLGAQINGGQINADADLVVGWEAVNRRPARDLPGLRQLLERPSPFVDE